MTNKATPRSCTKGESSIGSSTKDASQFASPANLASDRNRTGGKLFKKIFKILELSTFPRIHPNSQNHPKLMKNRKT